MTVQHQEKFKLTIPYWLFVLLVLAASCLYSVIAWSIRAYQFRRFARQHACTSPPTLTSSLLTGVRHKWNRLHERGDVFDDYMRGVFVAHGPTHAIATPLTRAVKAVYTIEPENVKTMLSSRFADYHRPRTMPHALGPVMGQGVFTSNGGAWQHSRGLVKAQFATKRIRRLGKLDVHVRNAFEAIGGLVDAAAAGGEEEEEEEEGEWTAVQDILPVFNRFTLDAATEFMFGTSAESHEAAMREHAEQERRSGRGGGGGSGKRDVGVGGKRDFWARSGLVMHDFGTAFDIALDYVALRLKLGRLWFLADSIRFRLACHKVKTFADSYIRDAAAHAADVAASRASGDKSSLDGDDRRFGLISELVESYPDKIALRNQVMQLLVAGRDTTAATLTWAFALLEAHPEVFARLRTTIVASFGTESAPLAPITYDSLRACEYLQWTILEVVRLYPTGPLNARKATVDTVLPVGGGPDGTAPIAVKAGTIVAYNTYLMHRREKLWGEDALSFRPERWEGRKHGWEYVPFHGGPQTCLGQQHALTEMAYVLTRMLQRFDAIESPSRATNFENGIRTILVPKNAIMLRFHFAKA